MKAIVQLAFLLPVLLLLWAVFASPVLLALYLSLRYMRRRAKRSFTAVLGLALVFSLLAAPVPTPIITVFVPHGFALTSESYYAQKEPGEVVFRTLWPWIVPSLLTTFVITLAVSWRYVTRPSDLPKPRLRHEAG